MRNLARLISSAKFKILSSLKSGGVLGKQLEAEVLSFINAWEKADRTFIHETKPIHILAYIFACKELEKTGEIRVSRGFDVPFPMTDYATAFSLGVGSK